MKNIFRIPVYNDLLELLGEEVFEITYLKANKHHQFRIVVNGTITKSVINLLDYRQGYKSQILSAISQHKSQELPKTKKFVKITELKNLYSKSVVKNVINYLLPINKETSRDELTKYNLI